MIPEKLQQYPLIRVCRPDCDSHSDCNKPGKRPVRSVNHDESASRIQEWRESGGNYGIVARDSNNLVIFDSDSEKFSTLLEDHLPETFTVQSGGAGHGRHYYFSCNEAERQTGWKEPEGSVRVANWHCVGPGSVHPDTGNHYKIIDGNDIAKVSQSQLTALYDILDDLDGVKSGGGGSGPAAAPSSHLHSIPEELDFIRREDKRREIAEILKTDSRHDQRVWMVGWLHGAAGLNATEITELIVSTATWPNVNRDVVADQVRSVINSSRSDRGTHYSKFGTADMDAEASERRKTESAEDHESSVAEEVNTDMVEYNDHEEVTILEGNEDGDSFKKVVRTTREEDGETVEYVSVKTGRVELVETVDGEEVLARRVNDSTSLGSPEYIGDLAEALSELDERING